MSRRCLSSVLVIATLAAGGWLWNRASDCVLAEAYALSGEPIIRVREIQLRAASLGGVLVRVFAAKNGAGYR